MNRKTEALEVEVVEIDGITPPAAVERRADEAPPRPQWQQWQGRVRTLDSRWWPLWVILGAVAVLFLLTFGVVIGVVFVIFRILRGIVRALVR